MLNFYETFLRRKIFHFKYGDFRIFSGRNRGRMKYVGGKSRRNTPPLQTCVFRKFRVNPGGNSFRGFFVIRFVKTASLKNDASAGANNALSFFLAANGALHGRRGTE